jgi:hypothetical protein
MIGLQRWSIPEHTAYAQIQARVWSVLEPELSRVGGLLLPGGIEGKVDSGFKTEIYGDHIHKYLQPDTWNTVTVWKYSIRK